MLLVFRESKARAYCTTSEDSILRHTTISASVNWVVKKLLRQVGDKNIISDKPGELIKWSKAKSLSESASSLLGSINNRNNHGMLLISLKRLRRRFLPPCEERLIKLILLSDRFTCLPNVLKIRGSFADWLDHFTQACDRARETFSADRRELEKVFSRDPTLQLLKSIEEEKKFPTAHRRLFAPLCAPFSSANAREMFVRGKAFARNCDAACCGAASDFN